MVSFIMNLISKIYYYVKKGKRKQGSHLMWQILSHANGEWSMVNGLGAGFGTPCRSFIYHGCCRSSLVKFWGWRACPSNTCTQLKGSGVTLSTTKLIKKPVMGWGLSLVWLPMFNIYELPQLQFSISFEVYLLDDCTTCVCPSTQ